MQALLTIGTSWFRECPLCSNHKSWSARCMNKLLPGRCCWLAFIVGVSWREKAGEVLTDSFRLCPYLDTGWYVGISCGYFLSHPNMQESLNYFLDFCQRELIYILMYICGKEKVRNLLCNHLSDILRACGYLYESGDIATSIYGTLYYLLWHLHELSAKFLHYYVILKSIYMLGLFANIYFITDVYLLWIVTHYIHSLQFSFLNVIYSMATHSSVLAWRIPGTEEPGGLLSMGSHRVGHDWSDLAAAFNLAIVSKTFSVALILFCC